ncbi:hypothetical protein BC829DRAFT_442137 [Chytridium lagenaria]|nr:hypothetical protein BC829DRAFT_442137 [Chytridium lagenaria]
MSSKPSKPRSDTKKARRQGGKEKKATSKVAEAAESEANTPSVSAEEKKRKVGVERKRYLPTFLTVHAELFPANVETLSDDTRSELSQKAKVVGNRLFGERKYEEAIKYYTQAINLKPDAVFYANRAACAANLGRYNEVIEDCNFALGLDARYVKAIYRRAQAYVSLEDHEHALLGNWKKENDEIMKTKSFELPSGTFVAAYMDSFRETTRSATKVLELTAENDADKLVISAYKALSERNWDLAMAQILEAVTLDLSAALKTYALTFEKAATYLDEALTLNPKDTNAMIKKASAKVKFLTGNLSAAIEDYRKSLSIDNDFIYAHIQLGVAMYKSGEQSQASLVFEKAKRKFPGSPEIFNYYGELKIDQQQFEEAILFSQWKKDLKMSETLCKKALEVDPLCDIAHIQLAQLYIQQSDFESAVNSYEAAIKVCRTEAELLNAICCREATVAQKHIAQLYPDIYAKLRSFM